MIKVINNILQKVLTLQDDILRGGILKMFSKRFIIIIIKLIIIIELIICHYHNKKTNI
jgi:hypothetical protein